MLGPGEQCAERKKSQPAGYFERGREAWTGCDGVAVGGAARMWIERSLSAVVADVLNGTVANATRLADSNDRQTKSNTSWRVER